MSNLNMFFLILGDTFGIPADCAKEKYEKFIDLVTRNLKLSGEMEFPNFGKLRVVEFKEHKSTHPRYSEREIIVPAKKRIQFKASSNLKKEIEDNKKD